MTIEAIKAVVDLIEMGGVVGQEDIVKCLRSAIEQAERQCCCGEPEAPGVVHRTDGPCYMAERREPVAWGYRSKRGQIIDCIAPEDHGPTTKEFNVPLYAAPPQRQPLTDEEIVACIDDVFYFALDDGNIDESHVIRFTRAIERAHGIGGGE